MSQFPRNVPATFGADTESLAQRNFLTKVMGWMAVGLMVTAIVALAVNQTHGVRDMVIRMFQSRAFFLVIIAQVVIAMVLGAAINKINATVATLLFMLYSAITGLTFSVLFMIFTTESLATTFFVTGGMFGAMATYGYLTKRDLSSMGSILLMALLGVVLASLVNMFIGSSSLGFAITIIGILVFVGLTAYDMQRIKYMYLAGADGSESHQKAAILGAFALYLDFINLFILLLQLLGDRRRD